MAQYLSKGRHSYLVIKDKFISIVESFLKGPRHRCGLRFAVLFFFVLHAAFFLYIHTRPILWQSNEVVFHKFFWSLNDIRSTVFNIYPQRESAAPWQDLRKLDDEAFQLHLGFQPVDFIKPFVAKEVDGPFRLRQFSYFLEMVSAKFWQYFEIVSLRNYTLIGIHILNSILLFFLIDGLTKNRFAAWSGAWLFLNSGVAMATLLFPQRNAKLLVMTFFLIDWLILIKNGADFSRIKLKGKIILILIALLAIFTDELAFIVFPFLLIYIAIEKGVRKLYARQLLVGVFVSVFTAGILYLATYLVSRAIDVQTTLEFQGDQLAKLRMYFGDISILTDTGRAFFSYFLRRNFGHWDFTFWGILAFLSFWGLVSTLLLKSKTGTHRGIILGLILILCIKAFFLPHSWGVHEIIMPKGTKFPSLLFFDFYYTYADSLLCTLILAILLSKVIFDVKKFLYVFAALSIIVASNVIHLKNGPEDCLAFHHAQDKEKQVVLENVVAIKDILSQKKLYPIYLSFPSGDEMVFKAKLYQPGGEEYFYPIYINVVYLRSLIEGKAMESLQNVTSAIPITPNQELQSAKIFYDVLSRSRIDLEAFRKISKSALLPRNIVYPVKTIPITPLNSNIRKIVFFVKGQASIMLMIDREIAQKKQSYGNSYQLFE